MTIGETTHAQLVFLICTSIQLGKIISRIHAILGLTWTIRNIVAIGDQAVILKAFFGITIYGYHNQTLYHLNVTSVEPVRTLLRYLRLEGALVTYSHRTKRLASPDGLVNKTLVTQNYLNETSTESLRTSITNLSVLNPGDPSTYNRT